MKMRYPSVTSGKCTRRLLVLAAASSTVLTFSAVARADANDPTPPANVTAIPTYSPTRPITVNWTNEEPLVTTFTIERSVNGGAFQNIGTAAEGETTFVDDSDKSANLNNVYTYQVIANVNAASSIATNSAASAIGVTWPLQDGSHTIMQGFADGSPNSSLAFHEGVDIFANGNSKTVIARGGTVSSSNNTGDTQGIVVVKVDVGGGNFEYDTYLHITNVQLAVGAVVTEGTVVANSIASFTAANTNSDHLHFSVTRQDVTTITTNDAFEKTWLNPLARFTKPADRDPLQQKPFLFDSNGDGKTFIITPAGKYIPQNAGYVDNTSKPVKAGVSMIADVQDNMNSSFNHSATPYSVGYWIESKFNVGVGKHDVRSAASPYVLSTFDDNWFNDQAFSKGKFSQVYADPATGGNAGLTPTDADFSSGFRIPVGDAPKNNTVFPFVNNFAITNTKGGDGRVANVDNTQFWKSDAANNAAADTANTADGVTFGTAGSNAQARFRDGDYVPHVLASDLVNPYQDLVPGKVRVDNFKQTCIVATDGVPSLAYAPQPAIYDTTDATPFLTKFDPESADTSLNFDMGALVYALGDQYYPDLLMSIYIEPHQAEWTQGDSLTADDIAAVNVMSDDNGFIQNSFVWDASMLGEFDVIIDYDRDGHFSSTLDGLGGLTVIPEPCTLAFLPASVMLLVRRRRA